MNSPLCEIRKSKGGLRGERERKMWGTESSVVMKIPLESEHGRGQDVSECFPRSEKKPTQHGAEHELSSMHVGTEQRIRHLSSMHLENEHRRRQLEEIVDAKSG